MKNEYLRFNKKETETNKNVSNQKKRVKAHEENKLPTYEEFKRDYKTQYNWFGIGCMFSVLISTPFELHWKIILSICFFISSIQSFTINKEDK